MCPDNEKTPEDEQTAHRGSAGPTPPTSPVDATVAYGSGTDPEDAGTVADEDGDAPTIAVPARHPTGNTATGGSAGQSSTGGGSVPFTPVQDMTSGSLEKAKAKTASKAPRSVGHRFANRFEVVDVLGEGGMGKVFRVRDTHIDNREMALKVLRPKYSNNPQFRTLFTKEIHAAQNFVSENVVQIRDTGQTADNQLFLTMDLVDGEDLHEMLKREGALLPRHALEIVRQTLIGLHSGHEQGFIHRDIKPSNVMLSAHVPKTDLNPYGVGVQLLDFGIAGIAAEVSGQIAGTPMYMSPEQAQGQRLDPRSDLFTVGVVMFEMLTGTRPFEGKTLDQVVTSILETKLTEMIADLKHLGRPVQKILTKALQKDREKRYQSASEFIGAIEKSKAFRIPTNLPAGTAVILGVAMLATIGQAAYIFTSQDSSRNLRQDRDELRTELNAAKTALNTQKAELLAEHTKLLASKESQFNLVINQTNTQLSQTKGALAVSEERANALAATNAGLLGQVVDKGDESGGLATDKKLQESEIKRLTRELEELRSRERVRDALVEEQEKQLARLQQATRLESITASGFDRLFVFLERQSSEAARRQMDTLQAQGIFAANGTDGGLLLEEFVSVAELLNQFVKSKADGAADPELLKAAEDGLVLIGTGIPDFETAASPWINETIGADKAPTRLANVRSLLLSMETRFEQLTTTLTNETESELEAILAGSPTQNPERAFQVASLGGEDFLPRVLQRCVNDLTSTYEARGDLVYSRLKALDCLTPWVEYLDSQGDAGSFDPSHVASLREFWTAKQWYFGSNQDRQDIGSALALPSISAPTPKKDWRASLALQTGLYFEDTLPQPRGRVAVYLITDSQTGSKRWFLEDTAEGEVVGSGETEYTTRLRPFRIEQHGVTASRATERKSTRKGWKFLEARTMVLDLIAKSENTEVVSWSSLAATDLPTIGGFPSVQERTSFQEKIAESSPLCLVVKDGKYVRWFSPTYGLVHYDDGRIQRDLVYLER